MKLFVWAFSILASAYAQTSNRGQPCITPNSENATCIAASSCKLIFEPLGTRDPMAIDFAKRSLCGYDTEPLFCCGSLAHLTRKVTHTTQAQHQGSRPVASPDYSANSIALRFNYFDIHLMKNFDDRKNYFISPASIKVTLGMVLEGARGKSANEIATILGIQSDPTKVREQLQGLIYSINAQSSTTRLENANAVFISDVYQVDLVREFEENLENFYHAPVQHLNFSKRQSTAAYINGWVSGKTQNPMTEIVQPGNISSDAAVVLLNALYFKGKWTHAFDERSTGLKCFHNTRYNCIKTKMMQITRTFKYKVWDNCQAVQLPYDDGEYAMLVMVPYEKMDVESLILDLTHTPFSSVVNRLEPVKVMVTLPVFSIHYITDLVADLQNVIDSFAFDSSTSLAIEDAQCCMRI